MSRVGLRRRALAPATERNRGVDPKRLLNTMHKAGIGNPKAPELPPISASVRANSKDAKMILLEKRQELLEQGGAGLRPVLARREYRLPLLVKYHKPKGMVTSMRVQKNIKKTDLEDLRSVVSFAGDEFELDLYHPVGGLATGASGLFLWSRSGRLTRQLQDPRRGVANILELEVCGAVRAEYLDEALQTGVNLGVTGFQRTYTASVLEAALLPDSSLQEPRSRVTILARDGRAQVPAMVERCGYKVVAQRRTQVGGLSLGDLEVGKLEAATTDEEVWACELAGLPASEYPESARPPEEERRPRRKSAPRERWRTGSRGPRNQKPLRA